MQSAGTRRPCAGQVARCQAWQPRRAIGSRLRGGCGSGRQPYGLLIAATVVLSTVANPVQATSGTASSAAGWSIRRASRA